MKNAKNARCPGIRSLLYGSLGATTKIESRLIIKTTFVFALFIGVLVLLVSSASIAMEYHHSEKALEKTLYKKEFSPYEGNTHEKVYDVVWSGDRKPGKDGKLPLVGNTVDVKNASWSNTIGAPELITVWTDPDFDPKQHAFYYARVIEIPTPRWTAYEAKRFNIEMPQKVHMVTQERAYTSPIWYTPEK